MAGTLEHVPKILGSAIALHVTLDKDRDYTAMRQTPRAAAVLTAGHLGIGAMMKWKGDQGVTTLASKSLGAPQSLPHRWLRSFSLACGPLS